MEEGKKTQWSKEKVQKDIQRSIKHTHKTKDRVTRVQTPLKIVVSRPILKPSVPSDTDPRSGLHCFNSLFQIHSVAVKYINSDKYIHIYRTWNHVSCTNTAQRILT